MNNLSIVAIPTDSDSAMALSSEKVPHMTLLFLGPTDDVSNLTGIVGFVQYASTLLDRFDLSVDHRGTLGPDDADVLFFDTSDRWGFKKIENFRYSLLQNNLIKAAYDSVQQYPEWQPHLTIGYPPTPARKPEGDYIPSLSYVFFDKIAVWDEDYAGYVFPLKENRGMDVSMETKEVVDSVLAHHGVKGMHWGVRRRSVGTPQEVVVKNTRKGVKATGGENQPSHEDAKKSAKSKQVAKKSSTDALSTKDLQELVTRMNLEQQYGKLSASQTHAGKKFATDILSNVAKQQASKAANDVIGRKIGGALK